MLLLGQHERAQQAYEALLPPVQALRDRAELAAGIYVEHGRADEVRGWLAAGGR